MTYLSPSQFIFLPCAIKRSLCLLLVIAATLALSACKEETPFEVLHAIGGDEEVSLIWTAPYLEIDHFNLYFSTVEGTAAEGQKIAEIPEIATNSKTGEFTHSGLTNGTTYYYVVTVVTVDGEELKPSNEVSATTYTPPIDAINGRYLPMGDQGEIIRDLGTGLEWQRCSLGQTWNAAQQSCDGDNNGYTWENATLQTAPGGFRLPTLTELQTLIECEEKIVFTFGRTACTGFYPTTDIDEDAFPNTSTGDYWSSDTLPGFVIPRSYDVGFKSGDYEGVDYNVLPHAVRLVRE